MLWSTVKLLLAIVMSIIFGPLKTLPRSSKSCDCVTFMVLKYLLSVFLLYTPHCHMILSKQKCCLWSTGVSTESQNPRLQSYGIYISQLVRFARCCTSVLDFHSKNLQITSKLLTQGYRYYKLRKTFGKFFRSYSELLSKFDDTLYFVPRICV